MAGGAADQTQMSGSPLFSADVGRRTSSPNHYCSLELLLAVTRYAVSSAALRYSILYTVFCIIRSVAWIRKERKRNDDCDFCDGFGIRTDFPFYPRNNMNRKLVY